METKAGIRLMAFILALCSTLSLQGQVEYFFDDFEDGEHALWKADHPQTFGLSESDGMLVVAYDRSGESAPWDNFNFSPPSLIEVSHDPQIRLRIRSDVATTFTVKPIYTNGSSGWIQQTLPADDAWHEYTFALDLANYSGSLLSRIYFYLDGGSSELSSGTVRLDDLRIGSFLIRVTDLEATLVDTASVALSWSATAADSIAHFHIYRGLEESFVADEGSRIATLDAYSYADTGLENYTTYHYKLSAVSHSGQEYPAAATTIRTYTPGAGPQVAILAAGADPVGLYEKYEIELGIYDADYDNPYDPDQLDLYAWFFSPDGDSLRINGFYDDYQGRDQWKIRFSPGVEGTWSYRVRLRDLHTESDPVSGSFTAVSSGHKGWVQISEQNPNYLAHDDGSTFYGLAAYYPWSVTESGLDELATAGVNIFGYWDCTFDWAGNGGGRYLFENLETGIGRYDQRKAARIDEVLEWSEARDLKVMLAIWTHPYLRISGVPWPNGFWHEHNAYSELFEPEEFFTDSSAMAFQDKHHRYLIARYGYSRALGIWELVNETHGTTGWVRERAGTKDWIRRTHDYFRANDPNRRPTTTSFGGGSGSTHFYPEDGLGDIVNIHFYEQHGWPTAFPEDIVRSGLANAVSEAGLLKSKGARPAFFGEAGYDHMLADPATVEYDWEFHNSFWAGLLHGMAATPFWWEFNTKSVMTGERMQNYRALGSFIEGLDLAGTSWNTLPLDMENSDAWVMSSPGVHLGWMYCYTDTAVSNAPLTLPNPIPQKGSYLLRWYDTWTGALVSADTLLGIDGLNPGKVPGRVPATIEHPDAAFRLERLEPAGSYNSIHLELWDEENIACYVTDASGRMDVNFNGMVQMDMQGDGQLGEFEIGLNSGGVLISYQVGEIPGVTVIASLEGAGTDTLLIDGGVPDTVDTLSVAGEIAISGLQAYPNPFDTRCQITYHLPETGLVRLEIHDLQGRLVEVLADGIQDAGYKAQVWNAEGHAAGTYLYRIRYAERVVTGRLIKLKP